MRPHIKRKPCPRWAGHALPTTGTFLISLNVSVASSSGHAITLLVSENLALLSLAGGTGTYSASTIAHLNESGMLSLSHSRTAQINLGLGKTELTALLL
ncbi:hypothetical protein ABID21_002605 [Pseudorhizobium tarimense]|uniref:Uncharacterized protein n=1 Tax=Pseudorhizobium tarimense TaxID=1079109 RepID=A0ABV2H7S2_9HYPH|nr:hypothetical protein [Pseudorhizobium tarimense]MCJ8519670.1 hypothetical protein [Pseudorhizobium tarimense]